jgi:hypothetical protein
MSEAHRVTVDPAQCGGRALRRDPKSLLWDAVGGRISGKAGDISMADTVMASIPVSREAAVALADETHRVKVGKLVGDMLRPGSLAEDPLAALIAEMKGDARAGGLIDTEIDAELTAEVARKQ